ncbi:MAG: hypothetical protein FJ118_05980 [Deltaproteobacteria bacterium]|nr:hypothetical protein [Deltaproteobacteria bacterium]
MRNSFNLPSADQVTEALRLIPAFLGGERPPDELSSLGLQEAERIKKRLGELDELLGSATSFIQGVLAGWIAAQMERDRESFNA